MDVESQYFVPFALGALITLAILIANIRAR